jgi:hypothetical protein
MIDKNIPSLGFREMHPMQVEAIVNFINLSINLAVITGDEDIIQEIENAADDMVHILGGNGVSIKVDVT